ncbi:MAG: 50S ribosomal protein L15 [Parcubacteria group bacterium GW2011_GWA2_47_16]|nr:MAG: 50S ribosomal protein L15 [Parcubacteria group bacterium GW2011_GWA2_47_16]
MQSHQLQRVHKNKRSVQVGRGGKRGKTSGRGGKGQTARAGHKIRPEIRDMIKRVPKLRGRGKNIFQSFQQKSLPINLDLIEKHFSAGDKITPQILAEKGLVSGNKGNELNVKVLATGDITKKLTFSGCTFSASAKAKIEKAGGTIS